MNGAEMWTRHAEFSEMPGEMASLVLFLGLMVFRATITWTGFTGSPGYTNFHFINPEENPSFAVVDEVGARCRTFFEAIKGLLPGSVRIDYPNKLERLSTATGQLEAEFTMTQPAQTAGTGLTNFSSATGACVSWRTIAFVNGRRVQGRTFIVPIASGSLDTDGTLNNTSRTTLANAAATFIDPAGTDMPLCVWRKPTTPGGSDGQAFDVSTSSVRDRTAILRSRRD